MAKIYSAPKEITIPELDFRDMKKYKEECEKFTQDLKEFCLKRKKGKNIGEIVYFPVADGNASYMVASMKPLELIHIPLGDSYDFQFIHLLTAKEIQQNIDLNKAISKIFG